MDERKLDELVEGKRSKKKKILHPKCKKMDFYVS